MFPRPLSARRFAALSFAAFVAVVLPLAGCTSKPENSPVIKKKFAEVDSIKTQVEESNKLMRTVAGDITVLKDQMSDLRALSPDAEGVVQVVARLDNIEKRLSAIDKQASVITTGSGAVPTTKTATPATEGDAPVTAAANKGLDGPDVLATGNAPKPAPEAATTPKETTKATTSSKSTKEVAKAETTKKATSSKTVASSSTSKPKTTTTASVSRGKYYTLQPGDTLEKIASSNGLSAADLAKANRLPSGAQPLKGQRLFIPASK